MSRVLRRDIYSLRAPGFSSDKVQVPDPDPLATVRYSCVYWVDHLCDSVSGTNTKWHNHLRDEKIVHEFLETKYLYWLEALSLLQAMPAGIVAIGKLESLLGGNGQSQLSKLVWDAYRFALSNKSIIEQAPLQAYISALVFAPSRSLIKRNFKGEEPEWIQTKPAMELDWNACLQTLEGHSIRVNSVAFSPDGQRLASGSHNTIKIWDPASGSCLQTLKGHRSIVNSVVFSPDGQRLASGSHDNTIKIWNPASGSCLQTIPTTTSITDISFDPTNRYLRTNVGHINIVTETTERQVVLDNSESHSYNLGQDKSWITCNGQNVLWLPPNYRPSWCYVQEQMISFICASGQIWFISVSQDI
ncbi:hypothetical protein SMAC4_13645 [Sordaria macrospora]|uniref:uncharacterized protein n=1 Tax=Sordaria macrospora TaxID=5147 RepID=UPI002B300186|nr:hypothetical protein SMAC4_13645 [Sordaria macrospora]